MNDGEAAFDARVQANIPSDLKVCVRELVKSNKYDSEAEIVREALWRFVHQPSIPASPRPTITPEPTPPPDGLTLGDFKSRMDLIAWMLTLVLMLVATVGSKLMKAQTGENISPIKLLEQVTTATGQNREALRRQLAAGWHQFNGTGQIAQPASSTKGTKVADGAKATNGAKVAKATNGTSPGKPQ